MKPSKLGKRIKYYREESKLTQQQLADKIGVTWEMISRYERGISEPYNRIDAIAKAFNINISELLQNDYDSSNTNSIPLFTKIPKDFDFKNENTNFFYTCPEWIYKKDKNVFAIDINLIKENNEGVYYISPNISPQITNLVLYEENKRLLLKKFKNQRKIIGVVLAKELKTI